MENINNYIFNYTAETEFFWKEGEEYDTLDGALNISIEKAVDDLMVRTEKVNKSEENTNIKLKLKETKFKKVLSTYFESNTVPKDYKNFDVFHHELCTLALSCLEEKYTNINYGKSQKLVNMIFKYLYCTKYINNKKDLFKYCHIALDSIILEWIYRYVYPQYEIINDKLKKKQKNTKNKKLTKDSTPSWSKLTYSEDEDLIKNDKYTYNFYIQIIKQYFEDNIAPDNKITPFQAEFIIWREMQMELASEAFYSSLQKYRNGSNTNIEKLQRDTSIAAKLETIKKLL